MSNDDLITIRQCGTPQEAHLAKNMLADADISAYVADEMTATWLWHVGTALGGTKLQVAKRDAQRARDMLQAVASEDCSARGSDWLCSHCGAAVDAGFDVCWSCEWPRGEAGEAEYDTLADRDAFGRSYESDQPDHLETVSPGDADAMRAWRAALFGLMFPPLLLYALYLTIKVMNRELSPRATWRYNAALAISLVMISLWWTVLVRL